MGEVYVRLPNLAEQLYAPRSMHRKTYLPDEVAVADRVKAFCRTGKSLHRVVEVGDAEVCLVLAGLIANRRGPCHWGDSYKPGFKRVYLAGVERKGAPGRIAEHGYLASTDKLWIEKELYELERQGYEVKGRSWEPPQPDIANPR